MTWGGRSVRVPKPVFSWEANFPGMWAMRACCRGEVTRALAADPFAAATSCFECDQKIELERDGYWRVQRQER